MCLCCSIDLVSICANKEIYNNNGSSDYITKIVFSCLLFIVIVTSILIASILKNSFNSCNYVGMSVFKIMYTGIMCTTLYNNK